MMMMMKPPSQMNLVMQRFKSKKKSAGSVFTLVVLLLFCKVSLGLLKGLFNKWTIIINSFLVYGSDRLQHHQNRFFWKWMDVLDCNLLNEENPFYYCQLCLVIRRMVAVQNKTCLFYRTLKWEVRSAVFSNYSRYFLFILLDPSYSQTSLPHGREDRLPDASRCAQTVSCWSHGNSSTPLVRFPSAH